MKSFRLLAAAIMALGLATGASAAIVTFQGLDNLAGPADPRPNSDAAAAAFDAALVPGFGVIDFEALPIGFFAGPLVVVPGVSVTATNTSSDAFGGIADDQVTSLGYNTTTGGEKYLRTVPIFGGPDLSVTFDFASPVSAFGGYFTGTEDGIAGFFEVTFNDGTAQLLSLPEHVGVGGGVYFFGFTDAGKSISSITINESGPFGDRDIWGLDDVRFGSAVSEPIPEPGSLALLGAGLLGMVVKRSRRR